MQTQKWTIVPYERAGPLAFGISQDEARGLLGKERLSHFDRDENETVLYWQDNGLQLVFDDEGLAMAGFYPNIRNIAIDGLPLKWNGSLPVLRHLLANDPLVMKGLGSFLVFFRYGIVARDFERRANSDKGVSAFRRGYWKPDSDLLRPVNSGKMLARLATMKKPIHWPAEENDFDLET